MNFANHSTNCTKITVFVASFNACMNLIHISLLEGDAPLVLISDWMRQLKTSCFCLGNRLKTAPCLLLQLFAQRQECNFFSSFCHCSFAIKFWTIFVVCFNDLLGEPPQPDLFDRPFQMCSCVFHCFKTRVCVSLFPLFYFKIFFLLWKNIWQLGCFSEWLPLLLLFRLRVLLGKNSVSA